jgi:hypothetical protein
MDLLTGTIAELHFHLPKIVLAKLSEKAFGSPGLQRSEDINS